VNAAPQKATLAADILGAIRAVVGEGPAALHEPRFAGNEWRYLRECLDSTFVSSVGPFVPRFEAQLAAYTGARYAVAVTNGTAALHLALRLARVGSNDEVLIPALTFVATANAVTYCGAVPHFVDSETSTFGVDARALREYLRASVVLRGGECVNRASGRVIRALVPMHVFGHPADIDELLAVAAEFHLALVEDAAESLGSTRGGRHTGTFGLLGTLSFNGNKTVTTAGGGAILTNDERLAARARHLATTAKVPHRWEYRHDEVAYNYRMPNLNAALGCAQLEQLPGFLESKRGLFREYEAALANTAGARLVAEPADCRSNYWLQTLLLDQTNIGLRDEILAAANDAGFAIRPAWTPMHRLPAFDGCPRMPLAVAESLERRIINLPSSAHLGRGTRA
jgi:perosamine synthetase